MDTHKPKSTCPICTNRNTDDVGKPGEFFPFCSERCKMADLAKWLSGDYFRRVDEDELEERPQ